VAVAIWKHGTEEQKSKYLPELCRGRAVGACAITEADSGSDALAMQTTATEDAASMY
jgi:alkylation response protein AidB-like acyl-CoA dehydrogenase